MNAKRGILTLLNAVILIAAGFFIGTAVLSGVAQGILPNTDSAPAQIEEVVTVDGTTSPTLTPDEATFAAVYDRVAPSTVAINVFTAQGGGSGSGFVIDQDGHIVTNYHVVAGAELIEVNFLDGTIVEGRIIGLDDDSDLAVLQVDLPPEKLFPVEFASIDDLTIGQTVLAIGSPFGQEWTMTAGIVSALNRTIASLDENAFSIGQAIQTDAPINPGNSGGPLLNTAGQVVGVNAQIQSRSGSNSGVGFAIPADLTVRVVNELISTGSVNYSLIGINAVPNGINLQLIQQYSLPNDLRGVPVARVSPNGPADQAGLRSVTDNAIDIIVAIDDAPINSFEALVGYLASETRPGDVVTMTIYRSGEYVDIQVTLGARD